MTSEPFGAALRRLRERAGLTQEQLAEGAGLSPRAISALERGERRHPYPHTVRKLASVLALTREESERLGATIEPRGRRYHLPRPPSPLIGREDAVRAVVEMLASGESRLLTLVGPGGIGKTRLAIAAGEAVGERFEDGVVFVSLAPVPDPDHVLPAVAHAMDLQESGALPLREIVLGYLRGRTMLLILDNLEHLPAASSHVVAMLGAASRLSVLATSRAPLRVQGEQVYPVRALGDEVAVQLFQARTAQIAPGTVADSRVVAQICRRLDGLPLAIELAAARTRVLPPPALLDRLDQPLALLTGGARDLPDRQQALTRTVAWSHDLLRGDERAMFRQLAVFANGWRLDDAAAVAELDEIAALELHSGLVDGSLIAGQPDSGEPRYGMLETIRAFASEQLELSGEEDATRDRHAARYRRLAMTAGGELWGAAQPEWLDRLELDLDNLRLALRRELDMGIVEGVAEACFALRMFWWIRGLLDEGRMWVDEALRSGPHLPPSSRARLLFTGAFLIVPTGRYAEASPMLEEAGQLARQEGDEATLAWALVMQAFAAIFQGRPDDAPLQLDEATALGRRVGLPDVVVRASMGRAHAAFSTGRVSDAEEVLAACQAEVGDAASPWTLAAAGAVRGRVLLAMGEAGRAEELLREAVRALARLRDQVVIGTTLAQLGAAAALRSDAGRAARLLGAADAIYERIGAAPWPWYRDLPQRGRVTALEQLGASAFEALYREGRGLPFDDVVAYAAED